MDSALGDLTGFCLQQQPWPNTPQLYLCSLTALSTISLCELCSILLAAKLIACQRLLQVQPCAEERQGSSYSGRAAQQWQTQEYRGRRGGTDRNVECQVENRIQTSSSHPFITICSLKQLFSEDQFPTNAPQWTADCLSSRMLTALTGMSC